MQQSPTIKPLSDRGSIWHRWDPHIHAPGTILNNKYKGADSWEEFLSLLEQSTPRVRALGVTEYFSLDGYEAVLQRKSQGRLPAVDLIFANVELRLQTGAPGKSAINIHLLISPEDSNHITEARRFLSQFEFYDGEDTFRCENSDLIRLGRKHGGSTLEEKQALQMGTNQFKIEHQQLLNKIQSNTWAKDNILVAVSGSSKDGTSTLQDETSQYGATRKSIERNSHIIFSGSPEQRTFWLGEGVVTAAELIRDYNGRKPCIHGSDAHQQAQVAAPALNRYTWIKGDLSFESLRQICLEPKERVIVADTAPVAGIDSQTITAFQVTNATWLQPASIDLNAGLVAIIGARGSGKTALADLIALGGHALQHQLSPTSFIKRARPYLDLASVKLEWRTGSSEEAAVRNLDFEDMLYPERVQYLSQQFVDRLCSSEGVTDELMAEIERVIFNAHAAQDKIGFENFAALRDAKSELARRNNANAQQRITQYSAAYQTEIAKKAGLPQQENDKQQLEHTIQQDKLSLQKLVTPNQQSRIKEYNAAAAALATVGGILKAAQTQLQSLTLLEKQVAADRAGTFNSYWLKLQQTHTDAGLTPTEWLSFKIDFVAPVNTLLSQKIQQATTWVSQLQGSVSTAVAPFQPNSYIPTGAQMNAQPYSLLYNEVQRLKYLVGIDNDNGKKYTALAEKITKAETELQVLNNSIADAKGADTRMNQLGANRKAAYQGAFDAIIEQQQVLEDLYQPLRQNLQGQTGTLNKLSFVVERTVDMAAWAQRGENLLDLRKNGPFKGQGMLLSIAQPLLKDVWEKGNAAAIAHAHDQFFQTYRRDFISQCPYEPSQKVERARWIAELADWLFGTDHISINYGLQYESVDIRQLSPGTRGIVLLLLYLAVDKEDLRPLIIDQPEENLDPKSIFDELVPLFRDAKQRRQIIIVTHNANLVVNTDADQVIVASRGVHRPGQLPVLSYESGSLENPVIRDIVCGILEGGKEAFKERAKRLRVVLQ